LFRSAQYRYRNTRRLPELYSKELAHCSFSGRLGINSNFRAEALNPKGETTVFAGRFLMPDY